MQGFRRRPISIWAGTSSLLAIGLAPFIFMFGDPRRQATGSGRPTGDIALQRAQAADGPGKMRRPDALEFFEARTKNCRPPHLPEVAMLWIDERKAGLVSTSTLRALRERLVNAYRKGEDVPEVSANDLVRPRAYPLPDGLTLIQLPERLGGAYNWLHFFYLVRAGRVETAELIEFELPMDGKLCLGPGLRNAHFDPKTRILTSRFWALPAIETGQTFTYVWTVDGFRIWRAESWLPENAELEGRRLKPHEWPVVFKRRLAGLPADLD